MTDKSLSADAKPFTPGTTGAGGGQVGGPASPAFVPSGPTPRIPGGPQPGPGPHGGGGGGPGPNNNARSPVHPNPHNNNLGGGGGGHFHGGDGGGGGPDRLPNIGGAPNVPMFNRNQNMGGGHNNNNQHSNFGGPNSHGAPHGHNQGGPQGPQGRYPGGGGGGGFNHHGGGPGMGNHHPQGGNQGGNWNQGGGNDRFGGGPQNNHHGPQGGGGFPPRGQGNFGGNQGGAPTGNFGGAPGHHAGPGPSHHGAPQPHGGPAHPAGPVHGHDQGQRPLVVLMLGVLCSGKSAVAQKICDNNNYMYIQNDEDMSGFVKLDGLLKQQTPGNRVRGYILDDFIIRSKDEIHYILHLLTKYRLSIDHVIYLQTDDMNGCLSRAGLEGAPEALKMAQHAAHYEATMEYFNGIRNLVIAPEDILSKSVEALATEILGILKTSTPGSKEKIHPQPLRLMNFGNFMADFSVFLQVRKQVTEWLGGRWSNFLTQSGGSLDYATFVRKNHNMRKYRASANFQGERIMVVKRGKDVVLIPENQFGMFTLEAHLVPTQFQTADDFIFDAIGVKLLGNNPNETENRIIFINDILYAAGEADSSTNLLSTSYYQRCQKVISQLVGVPGGSIFMQRPTFAINEIAKQLLQKEWKFPGDGLIFYPPGRYAPGQDPRILTFDFPKDALVTMRVWEGAAGTMDHPTNPPQNPPTGRKQQAPPPEQGWTFTALVLDYRGEEVLLDEKVQVVSEAAEKYNINDGCLLDFQRCTVVPPKPKQPVSYWKFVKRADHKAKPSLIESAQNIVAPDWNKDQLTAACCAMKPAGEFVPIATPAPAAPL